MTARTDTHLLGPKLDILVDRIIFVLVLLAFSYLGWQLLRGWVLPQ